MQFVSPIHFGCGNLSDSEYVLYSDAFISALCSELAMSDKEKIELLVSYFRDGNLTVSDAFPYISDRLFLPKPFILIEREQSMDSSVMRKAYKKLKYIQMEAFDDYLEGNFDVTSAPKMSELGLSYLKISASVRNEENLAKPFEVGTYAFNPGCGLYIIVGVNDNMAEELLDELIAQLSYSGIGGERSSGYGRFTYKKTEAPMELVNRLESTEGKCVLLNTALPQNSEMEKTLKNSGYGLIRRGGFVTSQNYSSFWRRRKDIYMFKSGSCFGQTFEGDVYEISNEEGEHPVYRFGKPMFMRITV